MLWGVFWVLALMLVFFVLLCVDVVKQLTHAPEGRKVENPAAEFSKYTSLTWPESASVVLVGDNHGGFHGDGEFFLVLDADRKTIEGWLSAQPPWGKPDWQDGAVPSDIVNHCRFGGEWTHSAALSSSDIRYCAEDFKMASIPWHNGRLLAINIKTGRVYLSWWDF